MQVAQVTHGKGGVSLLVLAPCQVHGNSTRLSLMLLLFLYPQDTFPSIMGFQTPGEQPLWGSLPKAEVFWSENHCSNLCHFASEFNKRNHPFFTAPCLQTDCRHASCAKEWGFLAVITYLPDCVIMVIDFLSQIYTALPSLQVTVYLVLSVQSLNGQRLFLCIVSLLQFFSGLFCRFWTPLRCSGFGGLWVEMPTPVGEPQECFQPEAEVTN